ncbi:MAG: hypothetical protein F083_2255 [bacterium F083]|nr:MAG: hypothetical protein F083_2255 [bacterium F083]
MEKEKNKAQKMAAELLQQIPFVECKLVETPAFYTDNRTKKVRVCKINGELWVPTIELGYGSPETNKISKLRFTGELTSQDLLPLRSKGSSPSWFIRHSAILRLQDQLEDIIHWEGCIACFHAILDMISDEKIDVPRAYEFSKEETDHIYELHDRRLELLKEGKKLEKLGLEEDYNESDFKDEFMKKFFSATEEELEEAMNAMEDIDELTGRIIGLCLDWVKHTGDKGGDWGNGLVMALTKATSYLLIALERQATKEKGRPSIIEFYQSMLPVCLEIAKEDIAKKEAAEREKRAKEGYN